jgi:multiple sugar transport system permease protein
MRQLQKWLSQFALINAVAVLCGIVMLIAFYTMPWFSFYELDPVEARQVGDLVDKEFSGAELLETYADDELEYLLASHLSSLFLIPLAAGLGIVAGLWGLIDVRAVSLARSGTLFAGALGLLHFGEFFLFEGGQNLNTYLDDGFIITLLATTALTGQSLLQRPNSMIKQRVIPGDMLALVSGLLLLVSFYFLPITQLLIEPPRFIEGQTTFTGAELVSDYEAPGYDIPINSADALRLPASTEQEMQDNAEKLARDTNSERATLNPDVNLLGFKFSAIILLPVGAVLGILFALWGIFDRRARNITPLLILIAGVISLTYYYRVFNVYENDAFEGYINAGFWGMFIGAAGLALQFMVDRPVVTEAEPYRFLRLSNFWQQQLSGYLLLLPALILFALFAWYPISRSVVMSFQDVNLAGDSTSTCTEELALDNLDNYADACLSNFELMVIDPGFSDAWRNSFEFAGLSVIMGFFVPVLVGILVNEMRLAKGFFRLVYFLPTVIPAVISLLVWQELYKVARSPTQNGYFNQLLMEFGYEKQFWLSNPDLVKPSILVIMTWGGFGATALLYLAALQDLPSELYEAAEIDGASMIDRIRHITLPHLRPTMLILLILQIIGVVQIFLEPFVLTAGGPGRETTTPVLKIYQKAFGNYQFGVASAWSVMLIAVLAVFSFIYLRYSKLMEEQ